MTIHNTLRFGFATFRQIFWVEAGGINIGWGWRGGGNHDRVRVEYGKKKCASRYRHGNRNRNRKTITFGCWCLISPPISGPNRHFAIDQLTNRHQFRRVPREKKTSSYPSAAAVGRKLSGPARWAHGTKNFLGSLRAVPCCSLSPGEYMCTKIRELSLKFPIIFSFMY